MVFVCRWRTGADEPFRSKLTGACVMAAPAKNHHWNQMIVVDWDGVRVMKIDLDGNGRIEAKPWKRQRSRNLLNIAPLVVENVVEPKPMADEKREKTGRRPVQLTFWHKVVMSVRTLMGDCPDDGGCDG